MSGRPIVLPALPLPDLGPEGAPGWGRSDAQVIAYARAAVEADRKGIVVTDDDVEAAMEAENLRGGSLRAALESYAKRLRGGT